MGAGAVLLLLILVGVAGLAIFTAGETRAYRDVFRAFLQTVVQQAEQLKQWCGSVELKDVNLADFSNTLSRWDQIMKLAAWMDTVIEKTRAKNKGDIVALRLLWAESSQYADRLLGEIGDTCNFTIHRNGDNEDLAGISVETIKQLSAYLKNPRSPISIQLPQIGQEKQSEGLEQQ